jgi:large subunit ribosomal protein L6
MSRIAKTPMIIPAGVEVSVSGESFTVKGKKGTLTKNFSLDKVDVSVEGTTVVFTPKDLKTPFGRAIWGTTAAHMRNLIEGVTNGYEKKLIVEGVGFKVALKGETLDLALGFSHPVILEIPADLTVTAVKNTITIAGIDKELVGSFSAFVRSHKKPEPYKGKGIRYHDEVVRRKQGKKTA